MVVRIRKEIGQSVNSCCEVLQSMVSHTRWRLRGRFFCSPVAAESPPGRFQKRARVHRQILRLGPFGAMLWRYKGMPAFSPHR